MLVHEKQISIVYGSVRNGNPAHEASPKVAIVRSHFRLYSCFVAIDKKEKHHTKANCSVSHTIKPFEFEKWEWWIGSGQSYWNARLAIA